MDNLNENVLKFIRLLKGNEVDDELKEDGLFDNWDSSYEITQEIFLKGDCGRLYNLLEFVFKDHEPKAYFVNRNKETDEYESHIVTKIGKYYYDIKGIFDTTDYELILVDNEYIRDNLLDINYSFNRRGPIL